jgi:toxin secretion/phage lysis holin
MDFLELFKDFKFTNAIWVFIIPTVLMAIDFFTGYLGAWVKKNVISSRMREGLVKKVGEISILLIGKLFEYGMGLSTYLMNCISFYIIFMELISVLENLDTIGVPIPLFIKNSLKKINKKVLEEDISDEEKKQLQEDNSGKEE